MEKAKVMMMGNIIDDFKSSVTKIHYKNGSKEDSVEVPDLLQAILKAQGKNKFLCTKEKPTWVDFYFFEIVNALEWNTSGKIFKESPALKLYHEDMRALPKLKDHLLKADAPEKKLQFTGEDQEYFKII